MKIISVPDKRELKVYCCNKLNFDITSVNNHLDKIEPFLYSLIYYGNDFINITNSDKCEYLLEFGIIVTRNTVSKYFDNIYSRLDI